MCYDTEKTLYFFLTNNSENKTKLTVYSRSTNCKHHIVKSTKWQNSCNTDPFIPIAFLSYRYCVLQI